jgi:hypothetical protein
MHENFSCYIWWTSTVSWELLAHYNLREKVDAAEEMGGDPCDIKERINKGGRSL